MASTIILSDNGASSGSAGLKSTAGNDGVLILQTTTSGGTATNAVYIDTSQNVGIGTSSPATILNASRDSGLSTGTGTTIALRLSDTGQDGGAGTWNTTQQFTAVQFYSADASGAGAAVRASVGATMESGSGATSALTFFTNASGTNTERMRINSNGNVGIGYSVSNSYRLYVKDSTAKATTTGYPFILSSSDASNTMDCIFERWGNSYYKIQVVEQGVAYRDLVLQSDGGNLLVGTTTTPTGATGSSFYTTTAGKWPLNARGQDRGISFILGATEGYAAYFERNQNSSLANCGYIYLNSNNTTTYATSSDYRLKENVQPMTGALGKVAQLKPCTYTWKADGSSGDGFIAHELQEVCPQAVHGVKDAVREDGTPEYQGIDTSFLVATLTAAIQEQQALITTLTERITALEAK